MFNIEHVYTRAAFCGWMNVEKSQSTADAERERVQRPILKERLLESRKERSRKDHLHHR